MDQRETVSACSRYEVRVVPRKNNLYDQFSKCGRRLFFFFPKRMDTQIVPRAAHGGNNDNQRLTGCNPIELIVLFRVSVLPS